MNRLYFILIAALLYTLYLVRLPLDTEPIAIWAEEQVKAWDALPLDDPSLPRMSLKDIEVPYRIAFLLNHAQPDQQYKESVMLLFLKIYSFQLYRHGQSFEIRESPFLLKRWTRSASLQKALLLLTQDQWFDQWYGPEFLAASEAVKYVESNPELLKHNPQLQKAYKDYLKILQLRHY
jgi:hypothetical protein